MELIILAGPGNCGKTTTLNIAYINMISSGAVSTTRKKEGGNPNDFSDVLLWKGKKIGILTMGDYSYRVIEFLDECKKNGCDVFVSACNGRFKRPFKKFSIYPVCHIITKAKAANPSLELSENTRDAARIVALV